MKKRISLLLVLSIITSMFMPMVTYAANTEAEELCNFIKGKMNGDIVYSIENAVTTNNVNKIKTDFEDFMNDLLAGIDPAKEAQLMDYYKLDISKITAIRDQYVTFLNTVPLNDLKIIVQEMKSKTNPMSVGSLTIIQAEIDKTKTILETGIPSSTTWRDEVIKESNTNAVYGYLWDALKDSFVGMKEDCLGQTKNVKILRRDNQTIRNSFKTMHDKVFVKSPAPTITDSMLTKVDGRIAVLESQLNTNMTAGRRLGLKEILRNFGFTYTEADCSGTTPPITPPSTGGQGGEIAKPPTTTNKKYVTETSKDTGSKVFLNKEHIQVTEKDKKSKVAIKENDIISAIAQLKKEIKDKNIENKNMDIVVKVDDVDAYNIEYVLTGKAMNALKNDNVSVVVETGQMSVRLPNGAIEVGRFVESEQIKLVVDELDNKKAADKVRDVDAVKKSLDLYIERVNASKVTRIDKLLKPLELTLNVKDLGNEELLAFYKINDEMDFLTGKIKNNKMVCKIKDLGKHVLVETYIKYNDTNNHWGKEEIKSMTAKNVVNGFGDNNFSPNASVTRAEFAKMVISALEIDLESYNGQFKDVKSSDWFAPYIATAQKLGIIKGRSETEFKPNDKILREEMTAILGRLDDEKLTEEEINKELSKYVDAKQVSDWARGYVAKASKNGFIIGKEDGVFDPKTDTSRASAATTMFRIYNVY